VEFVNKNISVVECCELFDKSPELNQHLNITTNPKHMSSKGDLAMLLPNCLTKDLNQGKLKNTIAATRGFSQWVLGILANCLTKFLSQEITKT